MKLLIDGSKIKDRETLHEYIKNELNFGEYYGCNLDALWDELVTRSEALDIEIINEGQLTNSLGEYKEMLIETLKESTRENENITLSLENKNKEVVQSNGGNNVDIKSKIRVIEDFPVEGISFKDITTLTKDKEAFKYAVKKMADNLRDKNIDYIVGPEARGFLFGGAVAYELGAGFVPVRKPGKLPGDVMVEEYELEYGTNRLEIHKDAIEENSNVAIVDDLLATGGTVKSVVKMIEKLGGNVVSLEFLIELTSLEGREILEGYNVNSLVQYEK